MHVRAEHGVLPLPFCCFTGGALADVLQRSLQTGAWFDVHVSRHSSVEAPLTILATSEGRQSITYTRTNLWLVIVGCAASAE